MKKLSIVIVTYNSEKYIFDCLDSIFEFNDIGEGLEVVVVDNCSDNQQLMIENIKQRYRHNVILVRSPCNGGYGDGNNQGVAIASAPYFIVMNPDVRIITPIFAQVISSMDSKLNVGMMGVRFIDGSKSLYLKPEYTDIISLLIDSATNFRLKSIRKYFFSGSFLIFRKTNFEEVGGFDTNIFMYHEEADISNRMLALNKDVVLNRNIFVEHLAHGRDVNIGLLKIKQKSRIYYIQKYGVNFKKYYRSYMCERILKIIMASLLNNSYKKREFIEDVKMFKEDLLMLHSRV